MIIDDAEVKSLNLEKIQLIKDLDSKLITQEEYDIKYIPLVKKIKEKVNIYKENKNKEISDSVLKNVPNVGDEKNIPEESTMTEEPVNTESKERKPRKVAKQRTSTISYYIVKALMTKGIKSWDEMALKVKESKPEIDKKRIINFAKALMYKVDKGVQPCWKKYTWDKENFLLEEKTQA